MKSSLVVMLSFIVMHTHAQPEKLGIIEIYGSADVAAADIKNAIGLHEGDSLIRKKFDKIGLENKIKSIPGIVAADVSLVCCDDKLGRSMLFISVSGKSLPPHSYNEAPRGNDRLDAYLLATYERYEEVLKEAVRAGKAEENDDQGHVLLSYPPALPLQDSLAVYASSHLLLLRQVLRSAADTRQRQAASWIIAFTGDKKAVVEDLLYAANDTDETVRNNAIRALAVLARYAGLHPSSGISVPAGPFMSMLRSIVWTDRNKGTMLLEAISRSRNGSVLQELKSEALDPITEMARWKNPGHALFSLMILGRIAGVSDEEIFAAYSADNRDVFINDWLRRISER